MGLVGDVQHDELRNDPEPVVYVPVLLAAQRYEPWVVSFVVRTTGEPPLLGALASAVRREVAALRPDIPVYGMDTMESVAHHATAPDLRFTLSLVAIAAATTLFLAVVGVYGVLAYVVSLRRNEFGLRIALGADRGDIRALVFRQASRVLLVGLAIGVPVSWFLAGTLQGLLYQIQPVDPLTYALSLSVLLGAFVFAASVPAGGAASVDPRTALE